MWNFIHGSAQGTSHRNSGKPCQDHGAIHVVETGFGSVLVAACADGAGSAKHSEVGARIAVETFLDAASSELLGGLDPSMIEEATLRSWKQIAVARIEEQARSMGVSSRQLACTFLTAVVGPSSAAFAQVGDGVIVVDGPDGYEFVFWPDTGEYANTTHFITDMDGDRHFRSDCQARPVQDVAMLTDGLQMLVLSYSETRVHGPFFRPIFASLRSAPDGEAMRADLVAFLNSNPVNARTDDDKTLILATRRPLGNHAPNRSNESD